MLKIITRGLTLSLILSAFLICRASSDTWQAGIARENITPDIPLWMTGYAVRTHPAEGTGIDLWVKALAFSDPMGNRSVILTLDLCGITREITDHVAQIIKDKFQLERSAVMINVSHTHCSPWIEGNLIGLRLFPESGYTLAHTYRLSLEEKMIKAASTALNSLKPCNISWSEDSAYFALNRRENLESSAALRRAAGTFRGPVDQRVPVLIIRDATTESIFGILVSYACHNTTLSYYKWNGDYAGYAQLEIEKRHPGCIALFAIGCAGDINPNPRGTVEMAQAHGKALAEATDRAINKPNHTIQGTFASSFEDITLHFKRLPTENEIATEMVKNQPAKEMHQAWATVIKKAVQEKGESLLTYNYPIQTWKLGDLMWAGLSGEVVVEYGLHLRNTTPGNLWVFSYCNDVMAYIPNERILKEGLYEGETSMVPYGRPSPWESGIEDKIMTETRTLLVRTAAK